MKTPKKFVENLDEKILTEDMIELVIYSINKRAKNYRDKKQENYRKAGNRGYDLYQRNGERYEGKEQEAYRDKEFLLNKLLKPKCIHKETIIKTKRIRYRDEYDEEYSIYAETEKVVHYGEYYDREIRTYVSFIDVIVDIEKDNYYLFYQTSNYSFHLPIDEEEITERNLDIVDIDNLNTKGKEIKELLSAQFCKKVVELVKTFNEDDYRGRAS
ncbi:hypothetical protein NNC19_18035 [Clostridium sp. SHJSY1]|uniref:hypothetical protein n=1 Tax=Clostridium sp. SHJSY1 TaxID=2942483 RepID=UPI002874D7C5|nr:hypothetical protein [Clostridium sp. SHJSY1]MDS0527593.1 hypothetical protein [Clostridium sp. SHJSY1]